jgi:iron complex transport system substrate-binding protein
MCFTAAPANRAATAGGARPLPALVALLALVLLPPATGAASETRFFLDGDGTLCDQGGRRTAVDRPFRRIISLYGAHTENLRDLGLAAEIIGVSQRDPFSAAAADGMRFSPGDDPERFLAAQPDLVLIRPMIERAHPGLVRHLSASGVAVVSLQPGTLDEMYRYWEILGALTARRAQAREMIRRFQHELETILARSAAIPRRRTVYFEAVHEVFKTFSPDAMPIFALEAAGGINAAADAQPVRGTNIAAYGKERLLARGEAIDVYLAQSGPMNRPSIQAIAAEPGFQLIRAVREGRIHIVDETLVSRPTRRLLDGVRLIGSLLYPEVFGEFPPPDGGQGGLQLPWPPPRR